MSEKKTTFSENPFRKDGISDEMWFDSCERFGEDLTREVIKKKLPEWKAFDEKMDAVFNSKETIWDYKPSEKELGEICEKMSLTSKDIITESRNGKNRLFCLMALFKLRKQKKDLKRVMEEYDIIYPGIL